MTASDNLMNSKDLLRAAAAWLALLILSLYHLKLHDAVHLVQHVRNNHCLNTDLQTIFGLINSYSILLVKLLHYFPH